MDRLTGAEELHDGPLDDRPALVGNLRDLARVNRRLGGIDLSARVKRATEAAPSNRDSILSALQTVSGVLARDPDLATLFLFEGRRPRAK